MGTLVIDQRKIASTLVAILAVAAGIAVAIPVSAQALEIPKVAHSSSVSPSPSPSPTPTPTPTIESLKFIELGPVIPAERRRSAAGSFYYVCVNSDGTTRTLTYGVQTSTCHGTALQQWRENGQFVQTISLSPHAATGSNWNGVACFLGATGATVSVLLTDGISLAWIIGTAATAGGWVIGCAGGL